ncbi:hypothetical protein [Thermotoga sp. KOL6]|uniref:hypothetical protein n=1 Tax=Thermotoga sp. KOL6 TaxID=126741 RepID=UPI000C76CE3B|nr:hypothetical protein [Thermotoga sp. KOL6]PLV59477.1 hypothetical protein AS005_06980 [Thermotoga sp. KOL6]
MRINSVRYDPVVYPNYTTRSATSNPNTTTVMSKEQMEQILFFALYQQTGLNMKLVRIAAELYSGKNLDLFA